MDRKLEEGAEWLRFRKINVYCTQAHGRLKNGDVGPGNRILAREVKRRWELNPAPILAQEEVAWALEELSVPVHTVISEKMVGLNQSTGLSTSDWNTYVIAVEQIKICVANRWDNAGIAAVPFHWARAIASYQKGAHDLKALFNPFMIPMPPDMRKYMHPDLVPGGLLGIQTCPRFVMRELCCRLYFYHKGRI